MNFEPPIRSYSNRASFEEELFFIPVFKDIFLLRICRGTFGLSDIKTFSFKTLKSPPIKAVFLPPLFDVHYSNIRQSSLCCFFNFIKRVQGPAVCSLV